jgi:hypothetical protein
MVFQKNKNRTSSARHLRRVLQAWSTKAKWSVIVKSSPYGYAPAFSACEVLLGG